MADIIDGVPADIKLDEKYIQTFLDKKPGQSGTHNEDNEVNPLQEVFSMEKQQVHQISAQLKIRT